MLWIGKVTSCQLESQGIEVQFLARARDFLFSAGSRPSLGPSHPAIQWVLRTCSPRITLQQHEGDHLSLSSAEVKNGGAIPPLSIRFHGMKLNKIGLSKTLPFLTLRNSHISHPEFNISEVLLVTWRKWTQWSTLKYKNVRQCLFFLDAQVLKKLFYIFIDIVFGLSIIFIDQCCFSTQVLWIMKISL
jgi:hypothetical protein